MTRGGFSIQFVGTERRRHEPVGPVPDVCVNVLTSGDSRGQVTTAREDLPCHLPGRREVKSRYPFEDPPSDSLLVHLEALLVEFGAGCPDRVRLLFEEDLGFLD